MSKFVTYPAVTVLDNDHSLLIDDPNAGTNSITTENAGNTLLSKWAGFETFDEAVQNTISNNQEFIDRDAAIREETAELKKKIVTTFPAKEASGAVATFESEFEDAPLKSCIVRVEPVQDLHGYDHPWPAGGGKNKINVPDVTLSGNSYIFNLTNLSIPAGTYTFSMETAAVTTPSFAVSGANGDYLNTSIPNPFTFTVDGEITGIRCYSAAGTYSKIMLEAGSTKTSYAPYSNICPISGWTGCEVQRTGKNLLDLSNLRKGNFEGATTNTNVTFDDEYQPIKGGQTYVWSSLLSTISGRYPRFYDVNKTELLEVNLYGTGDKTFSAPSNARYFRAMWYALTGVEPTDIVADQIELGSTATPYEPYTGQTYSITFPSEAGTVYGGYIDPINGELVVDRAIVDLGSLNFKKDGDREIQRYYTNELSTLIKKPSKTSELANIITSCFKVITQSESWSQDGTVSVTTSGSIYFMTSAYSTVSDFKTAMSGVQLCYELAEPIHYPITAIDIKTLLGQNNIWADTGDVSVEYLMSDVSWYVEKKLRAFQSILAGVEDSSTASKNYSANTYLVFNDDIYRVTKAITAGETIEEGVNVTKTTVAEQLLALAQA